MDETMVTAVEWTKKFQTFTLTSQTGFPSDSPASLPAELLLIISAGQNTRSDSHRCRKSAASPPVFGFIVCRTLYYAGQFFFFVISSSGCHGADR